MEKNKTKQGCYSNTIYISLHCEERTIKTPDWESGTEMTYDPKPEPILICLLITPFRPGMNFPFQVHSITLLEKKVLSTQVT